jgi:cell filamentation protein
VSFVGPYLYPGTQVLRNKAEICDEQVLRRFEYEQTGERIKELRQRPIAGKFDLEHLRAIHAHIFQDVYEWAGELRTVEISKGDSLFALTPYIEGEAQRLGASLAAEKHLQGLDKPRFVERLAHYYAEWNALHPFREGNGRSTREFIAQLAREAGYEFDQKHIDNDKNQWNDAAMRSFKGDLEPMQQIFNEAVKPGKALASTSGPARVC